MKTCLHILVLLILTIDLQGQDQLWHPTRIVVRIDDSKSNERRLDPKISREQIKLLPEVLDLLDLRNSASNERTTPSKYLEGIFFADLEAGTDILQLTRSLSKYSNVVYAEPLYGVSPLTIPNDPAAQPGAQQTYLNIVKAYDAWNTTAGRSSIIIASIDSGIDPAHEDLQSNVFRNLNEPINGVDDDGNGYIDDFQGWDMADQDNDPFADKDSHGTKVAGIHSAVGNNGVGLAGIAYDCSLLPIKIFRSGDNLSFNSYEAILYAADMGAAVMNLSWGSATYFSYFNQDIINYAALEKDVVIVAAAGNTNAELDFYPASYDNVISVGFTGDDDVKAPGATYSTKIDLVAPGRNIYSTNNNNNYASESGSSFAAPIVAGAAALLRDHFPSYTANQISEQLRATADPIYQIDENAVYFGKLGSGRLNISKALSPDLTSVRFEDYDVQGRFGTNLFSGDTVSISGSFRNYLSSVNNLTVTLTSNSPFVNILNGNLEIGSLSTNELLNKYDEPFEIVLGDALPAESEIMLIIEFSAEGYKDYQYLKIDANSTYFNFQAGDLELTVAGNGNLAYKQDVFDDGIGYRYEGSIQSSQLGIIVGNSDFAISNTLADKFTGTRDQDFASYATLKVLDSSIADRYLESFFRDTTGQSNLLIEQKTIGWSDLDAIVIEYRLINNQANTLNDLQLGLYVDFDLATSYENKTEYYTENTIGYTFSPTADQFAGTHVIGSSDVRFTGIDLGEFNGNLTDIDSLFTDELKQEFIVPGSTKTSAGSIGAGNDVSQVQVGSIGNMPGYSAVKLAYVLSSSTSLEGLSTNIAEATERYKQFLQAPPVVKIDSVCAGESIVVSLNDGNRFNFYADVSKSTLLHIGNDFEIADVATDQELFVANADSAYEGDLRRVLVVLNEPVAKFSLPVDTLLFSPGESASIQLLNESEGAQEYFWDFGNGSTSNQINPIATYADPGEYLISLTATSGTNCQSISEKRILVIERPGIPIVAPIFFCPGQPEEIILSDKDTFKLYQDIALQLPIATGNRFLLDDIENDTVFYLTLISNGVESLPSALELIANGPEAGFTVMHDSTDLSSNRRLVAIDGSSDATSIEWLIDGTSRTEQNPSFDWDGSSAINITQIVGNEDFGCVISKNEILLPESSQKPQVLDTSICSTLEFQLSPEDPPRQYIFYSDSLGSQILDKGKTFNFQGQQESTTIYVAATDELLESELVAWHINFQDFTNSVQANPAQLILEDGSQVTFSGSAQDAVFWRWSVNGDFVESVANPTLFFNEPGTYEIRLISENAAGCVSESNLAYEVLNVTALESDEIRIVKVYPNPSTESVSIESPFRIATALVSDLNGREILSQEIGDFSAKLRLHPDLHGIFFLMVTMSNGDIIRFKIIR